MGSASRKKEAAKADRQVQKIKDALKRQKDAESFHVYPKLSGKYTVSSPTGRMSSTRPIPQELPRLCNDRATLYAAEKFKVKPEEVTLAQRQVAKNNLYLLAYSISSKVSKVKRSDDMTIEELYDWQKREEQAKQVKHTVVPLHKSNYILVTDLSLIPGMVSKSGSK